MNVCVPLKVYTLKLYPQCDGIRSWDLWQVSKFG